MHIQFLIEDISGKALVDGIMSKVIAAGAEVTYDSKAFHGIGGFTKKNTVKETKTGKLLNDLATYLRGFNKSFMNYACVIIVVLDNDDKNTAVFQAQLESVAQENDITVDHVFCIAIEEVEAWLLGDEAAILKAYPHAKLQFLHAYVQDSICGTWETLADVVYPGGHLKLKKDGVSYIGIGKQKSEWAKNVVAYMNLSDNQSPSFNYFMNEINKRISGIS